MFKKEYDELLNDTDEEGINDSELVDEDFREIALGTIRPKVISMILITSIILLAITYLKQLGPIASQQVHYQEKAPGHNDAIKQPPFQVGIPWQGNIVSELQVTDTNQLFQPKCEYGPHRNTPKRHKSRPSTN